MSKLPKLIEALPQSILDSIQNKLLKTRSPLYIESISRDLMSKKSYHTGLNYIVRGNINYRTYYASSNRVQCYPGRNRSQGDLYMIMRYYYPEITFAEFRLALFKLLNEQKLNTFFCNTINKRIFFKHSYSLSKEESPFMSSLMQVDEFKSTFKFSDGIDRDDNNFEDWIYVPDYDYNRNYYEYEDWK